MASTVGSTTTGTLGDISASVAVASLAFMAVMYFINRHDQAKAKKAAQAAK